ncbi:hypothetical protein GR255_24795, partial [Mycobacterium tuberculosis]|nr:hypothetical protein [Mycobacterium tuberculosis]
FWGIGSRTEKRLNKLKIYSIRDLANANPDILKKEFGIIGVQLWFHANGVDESKPSVPYKPKSKGLGNSQVLPKDYTIKSQIELVLSEMAEQVAIRLRPYEDVETKVWNIKSLTDFWGIGSRTEKRLNKLKIYSIRDLANANPDILK